MKKFLSLILSALIIFTVAIPAFAVTDEGKLPVIYIYGKQNTPVYKLDENGNWLLDEKGNRVQADNVNTPLGMTREEYILTQVEPVIKELVPAFLTDDYSKYIDTLVDAFRPVYEDSVLNKDGTSSNTAIDWDYSVQQPTVGAGGLKYYYFRYDWRYSPYDTADKLHQFVEYVCAKEKVEKVNIHARCYGSNVAMAYIAKSEAGAYNTPFRINNLALNTTPIAGYIVVGALMSGSLVFNPDTMDRYITLYLNGNDIFEDPTMEMLAVTLISVTNQIKLLGFGLDIVQGIYDKIADEVVPALALVSYGTFPSYWSMIGDKYYEKAKKMVFKTTAAEGEYAEFIKKIDAYHSLLGKMDPETGKYLYELVLERCKEKFGMKTCILAKYGYQSFPFFENSEMSGDARGTVTELSLGALGNVINETFTAKELESIKALDGYDEKYLSPDKQVYAGTCLFPDTTWFSKNLRHMDLLQIDPIVTEFFLSDGTLTVHSDERYPQFFNYDNGKFVEVEAVGGGNSGNGDGNNGNSGSPVWTDNPFLVFIRFFTAILNFFTSLFKR